MRAQSGCLVLSLVALAACPSKPTEPKPTVEVETPPPVEDDYELRVLEPSEFETLEVLHFPEPVGDGYRRVAVEYGPPLYSGKWLRLANGDSRFLAARHLIVTEYRDRPKNPRIDPVIGNVILDVDSGEVVARFAERLDVHWDHGFALVTQADDPTPMLFTPATVKLVPAVPEGEHGYVYGENYWLRISPIAPRVWIIAEDRDGQAHVYEWEELGSPPPVPNNPVAFMPREWYPERSRSLVGVDHEEVWNPAGEDCEQAILEPPRGFRCLDETPLAGTEPVGDGWRFDRDEGVVFADPGERVSLVKLCPGGELDMQVFYDSMLKLRCLGDDSVWGLWSAPDRVRVLDEKWAKRVVPPTFRPNEPNVDRGQRLRPFVHARTGELELLGIEPDNVRTWLHPESRVRELVGEDYVCDETAGRAADGEYFAVKCQASQSAWFDVVSSKRRVRAKANVEDLAIGASGKMMVVKWDDVRRVTIK